MIFLNALSSKIQCAGGFQLPRVFAVATLLASSTFVSQAHAYLTASPSFVNFFDTEVGGFGPTEMVYVRNNSNEPEEGLTVFDNCFGDFQVSNYGCYGTLPPYGSCSLSIRFEPRSEGLHTCSIQIRSRTSFETVHVQGRGVKRRDTAEVSDNTTGSETPE
jgi:hypothetical protein